MEELFAGAKDSRYSRGQEVQVSGRVHYIREGYVGLYGQNGKVRRLLFVYKAGDVIPMFDGAVDKLDRTYVYIAMKRIRIRSLPSADFEQALKNPVYAITALAYARQISMLQFERINNMQQTQVFARLIERLLFFSSRLGEEIDGKIRIEVPLSHVDIATSIGATRETVNRYMRQLESQGVLTVKRQHITILLPAKLHQLINKKGALSSKLDATWARYNCGSSTHADCRLATAPYAASFC